MSDTETESSFQTALTSAGKEEENPTSLENELESGDEAQTVPDLGDKEANDALCVLQTKYLSTKAEISTLRTHLEDTTKAYKRENALRAQSDEAEKRRAKLDHEVIEARERLRKLEKSLAHACKDEEKAAQAENAARARWWSLHVSLREENRKVRRIKEPEVLLEKYAKVKLVE